MEKQQKQQQELHKAFQDVIDLLKERDPKAPLDNKTAWNILELFQKIMFPLDIQSIIGSTNK